MKNKLVFSIIWTHVFVMCSFMLLILFCLFITISPWAESHPWLWLMPWQKLRGSTLWEGGVESQLLGSSATLLDPEVQRRCSGGCPSWAGSPWRIPELWAGPAWQRCRERARAAALSAAFPGHGPGGLGKGSCLQGTLLLLLLALLKPALPAVRLCWKIGYREQHRFSNSSNAALSSRLFSLESEHLVFGNISSARQLSF